MWELSLAVGEKSEFNVGEFEDSPECYEFSKMYLSCNYSIKEIGSLVMVLSTLRVSVYFQYLLQAIRLTY